ncbi:MAG: hypothetical protein LBE78_04870 [Burkholderiaceae bacterium]|jgi:uncharacterized membrane protein|nr:hypothetical protein [Burkholderiaceae bacterium]
MRFPNGFTVAAAFLPLLAPLGLVVGYGLGAQWLMRHAPHHLLTVLFVLGPGLLGICAALWSAGRRVWATLPLIAGACALGWWSAWRGPPDVSVLYMAEYVSLYSVLAWLFWRSLRGKPLITQLARSVHRLTPEMERYTVKITRAWALYFAVMGLLSLLLFAMLPFNWWVLYTSVVSPLTLGAFFITEHVLRYRWHPEFERASFWDSARAWRRRHASERLEPENGG